MSDEVMKSFIEIYEGVWKVVWVWRKSMSVSGRVFGCEGKVSECKEVWMTIKRNILLCMRVRMHGTESECHERKYEAEG